MGVRPQYEQQEGMDPISKGVWNICIVTCCRYGHIKIRQDKYWKKIPIGKDLS